MQRTNQSAARLWAVSAMASAVLTLVACGGSDTVDDKVTPAAVREHILAKGSGGGGGGGGTVVVSDTSASLLPSTPPAPDILVRESFGFGNNLRPASGKGLPRDVFVHTTLGNFWVEYPGSKNSAWITPDGNQTWKFAAIGGALDPYELPSPLQATDASQGAIVSEWFDPVTQSPTALMPFTAPATPYAVSMEGYPSIVAGAYVAIGLTSSGQTISNFESVGQVWLSLRKQQSTLNGPLVYELRLNGRSGALLAEGVVADVTWNQMTIGYDPVNRNLSASVNGTSLGTFPLTMAAPRYAGFEGVGVLDNFVIRSLP